MNFKKGDKIKLMRGKDRGKDGQVLQVIKKDETLIVEGVNVRFKHLRSRKGNEKGQRVEFPAPVAVSNVMLICTKCSKPTRMSTRIDESGKKERRCTKCNKSFT